jgi:hypothetical protein
LGSGLARDIPRSCGGRPTALPPSSPTWTMGSCTQRAKRKIKNGHHRSQQPSPSTGSTCQQKMYEVFSNGTKSRYLTSPWTRSRSSPGRGRVAPFGFLIYFRNDVRPVMEPSRRDRSKLGGQRRAGRLMRNQGRPPSVNLLLAQYPDRSRAQTHPQCAVTRGQVRPGACSARQAPLDIPSQGQRGQS